ncbi:glucose-6-phosphate exchanger SLC37A2-like isoform X1 [Ruditapes philippinarum]|uniref:glucose-6-phosphate exchanger SLC37A2-like isoform X1 n=1 Tax=Ruditapes philippinarum TaxID=129788 RepID=UPI00295B11D9|nr:glucose-6-phosphate exchanger SLC37A2-like isoform X1 [Ruditapes philippinarum]
MARSVPLGIRLLPALPGVDRNVAYKFFILVFTFFCYMSYHLSRKPISIVKSVLHRKNCSIPLLPTEVAKFDNSTDCDWAPFNHGDFATLLGSLDLAYLFAYAVGMFFSGHIAERMNLRHFLSLGMITSGILTAAFGMGYFLGIHMLWYYILVQIIGGLVQSSGWPSVVACVGNWYGKGKRGLIMGIWNSHTSVGNILGSLIAGVWVNHAWGWSFIVPGIIIGCLGILVFFFLVPEPGAVNCDRPVHHIAGEEQNGAQSTDGVVTVLKTEQAPVAHPDVNCNEKINLGFNDSDLDKKKIDLSEVIIDPSRAVVTFNGEKVVLSNWCNGAVLNGSVQNGPHLTNDEVHDKHQGGARPFPELVTNTGLPTKEEPLMRTGDDDIDHKKDEAISLFKALMIPGVIEFSLCLFFAKLVSYTFLFWLPKYISYKTSYDAEVAGDLSTLFDVGGIVGGITAGLISDFTRGRASTCCVMLLLAAPMMFLYNEYGSINYAHSVGLLLICGFFVNGPYALITTAVSADLGTHKSLKGNSRALASVTAIIDGTGSIGAAIGPLLTGVISPTGWNNVFWMLIAADGLAMVFLIRLVTKEIQLWRLTGCTRQIDDVSVNVNIQNTL